MTHRYPDGHPQREFEDHYEGVWVRKWWAWVESPIKVTSYSVGEITNKLRSLHAVSDDGFDAYIGPRALRRWYRRQQPEPVEEEGMATTRSWAG